MKDCIYHLLLASAVLVTVVPACTYKDEVPSPVETISLAVAPGAVYDDLTGDFSFTVANDSENMSIGFVIGSQLDKISQSVPLPETGLYTLESGDGRFRVMEGTRMTDSSGVTELSAARVSVSCEGSVCRISGVVSGTSGSSVRFDAEGITFSHSASLLTFDDVRGEYDGSGFRFRLSGNGSVLEMAIPVTGGTPDCPVLPEGDYSISKGNMTDCIYSDGQTETGISEMSCMVSREEGGYVMQGSFMTEAGDNYRFAYEGLLSYSEMQPNIYLALAGQWDMRTDGWYSYDKETGQWVESGSGEGFSVTVAGLPDYSSFIMEDVFEADFAMMLDYTADGLVIRSDASSNPVAQVSATTGTYILFPALYDFENGRFLAEGNDIPVSLSEDLSLMSIPAVEADGNTYDYFGLIGRNVSSGSYSMFSNWSFIHVPDFVAGSSGEEPARAMKTVSLSEISSSAVSGIIRAEDIIKIEPVKRQF